VGLVEADSPREEFDGATILLLLEDGAADHWLRRSLPSRGP
jgi:hypothetical protein